MDGDNNNPDVKSSELPALSSQHHERSQSMSKGDEAAPANGDAVVSAGPEPTKVDPNARVVHDVINSEIGISTLLNRLKQSIASAKEFAQFLKKRSALEEEHASGLKKLCRITSESMRRPEHRHGSFLQSYEDVTAIHERMADNGNQFAMSLHQMHDDLMEMLANVERNRKQWKAAGLAAEQRVADTEAAMRKSKSKYDALADDYDRARTGDRQSGKIFGLKGPKSAAQHEEDLLRKVQAADTDYSAKVQAAQSQRAELWAKLRPEAVQALEDLIKEADSALTLQMQKFASFNEKLLLSNGLNISPMGRGDQGKQSRSLREAVYSIDNEKDLNSYISSFATKVPPRGADIKYERHSVLNPTQPVAATPQRQSDPPSSFSSRHGPPQAYGALQSPHQTHVSPPYHQGPPPAAQPHERSFSQGAPLQQYGTGAMGIPPKGPLGHGASYNSSSINSNGPPQLSTLPFQKSQTPPQLSTLPFQKSQTPPQLSTLPFQKSQTPPQLSTLPFQKSQTPPPVYPLHQQQSSTPYSQPAVSEKSSHLPPLNPVFGLSLEKLFERDGSAVPMVVYQCIQAVDLFGLEVEGTYRLSGSATHVTKIKAMFDNDASSVDFRNPENFFHDVNSVAGLLKQFFRELPDPLLTTEHYESFIAAAKNEDDIVRRDSLHAIINSLPDPNYATLRAVTLHLNRVQENSSANRMNASNLAIVFGPTLMGANTGSNIKDAGWQVKVIETILNNTYQIFDDD